MGITRFIAKFVFFSVLLIAGAAKAQISHGGKPLPYFSVRSMPYDLFEEMPPFDIEAEKRIDSLTQNNLRGGFRFAYKFMTDFTPANSGHTFTLADGTKVWRLGIRSAHAYSINVLFTEYELPEGAKLFLYSPDQSRVLGSFTHLNNSEFGLLPVSPIPGEEIIIEYQEPAGADFPGRLKVGEVNHAYRSLRGTEPADTDSDFYCMPPVVCATDTTDKYNEIIRSVVLLIIDGTSLCSGALINNTSNDKTPYLLTASHCLNEQFTNPNPDYVKVASTIVSFFNYESPFCEPILRGTEELSMASAKFYAVNEQTDMALLGLMDIPPVYYRPYYAGWNITNSPSGPYTNIHHPLGSVKRINSNSAIELRSHGGMPGFNKNSFWHVNKWDTGSTANGSSGSPLFDHENRVVGALTGGNSYCSSPKNDIFYALHTSWTAGKGDSTNLKPWLDPKGTGATVCKGLDPYEAEQALKLSNVQASGYRELSEVAPLPLPETGHQFGVNSLQTTEYAECYTMDGEATLFGAYFVTPPIQNNDKLHVEVNVYSPSGNNSPGNSLYTTTFQPTYTNKQVINEDFQETPKPLNRAQESFIKFDTAVTVSDRFFIGYKITAFGKDSFTVYSLPPKSTTQNTAWVKHQNKWIENTKHPVKAYRSSLFISPVIQKKAIPIANTENPLATIGVFTDRIAKRITVKLPADMPHVNYELFSIDGKLIRNGTLTEDQNNLYLQRTGLFILGIYFKNKKQVTKIVL